MYVFMHYEPCEMHIYSLYVLICSCSTWPLGFVIPLNLKKWQIHHAPGREGKLLPAILIVEPDFGNGGRHHCCSIWRPLLHLGAVTWSVFPVMYISVQIRVYLFEAKEGRRSGCAWLARMVCCTNWGLAHELAGPFSTWEEHCVFSAKTLCSFLKN